MTVLNVLSTNSIASGASEYQTVQTGFYRVSATAAATVQFGAGPVIQILAGTAVLLKGNAKPGQAKIVKAVDDATADYVLGTNYPLETTNTHPFSVGDFIAVVNNSTDPAIDSNFLSAGTAGKKVTAVSSNGTTISTDVDSSSASADYTWDPAGASNNQAIVQRAVKITAGGNTIIVEEVQVVGG
tara:strand:- start:197 stop:751 length:555 start_codon:yes stop_codon:yes gene_type:complete